MLLFVGAEGHKERLNIDIRCLRYEFSPLEHLSLRFQADHKVVISSIVVGQYLDVRILRGELHSFDVCV